MESYDGEVALRIEKPGFFSSGKQTMFYKNKNKTKYGYNAYIEPQKLPISLYLVKVLSSKGIVGIKDGKLIFLDSTASQQNMEQIKQINDSTNAKKDMIKLQKTIDEHIIQQTKNTSSWWGTAKKLAPWAIAAGITFVGYKGLQQLKQKQK